MKLIAGIDIGGTNTVVGLVGPGGKIHGRTKLKTADFPLIDDFVAALCDALERLGRETGAEIVGIGVGAPNANPITGNIESAPNLPWEGSVPLLAKLEAKFPGTPLALTNDAKAAALGEMACGGAVGMKDFIVVTLGTGVGSGFVAGGELIYGHGGMAGELGHVTVHPGGRLCGCGRRGCLETYASAGGIVATALELLEDGASASPLRDVNPGELTAETIAGAAAEGDRVALDAFESAGVALGRALAMAVAVTSPETIFLTGGLSRAGKYILEPAQRYMEENLLDIYRDKVRVLLSSLEADDAAILGAAALVADCG